MTLKGHKKHVEISKPLGGKFHRNEIAILGAPCGIIQTLSQSLASALAPLKVGYVDASHGNDEPGSIFNVAYTDMIQFHATSFDSRHVAYEFRNLYNSSDLVLVNGNHFKATQQFVIINQAKKESLQRKLDRLTNVRAFILDEGVSEIHDFLHEGFADVPVYSIQDTGALTDALKALVLAPVLKGLILAGGKSTRMGEDKGGITYHGKPHREFLADLLEDVTEGTYLSVAGNLDVTDYTVLEDSFLDLGPFGGILSAFRVDPNAAWFTVATDVPFLNEKTIELLIAERDPSQFATCFHNPETKFPEPLITIWEPRMYPRLLQFLAAGHTCPRKALINSAIKEVHLNDPSVLFNANTQEEKEEALAKIHG